LATCGQYKFIHFVHPSSILLGNNAGYWPRRRVPVPYNFFAAVP
jgi:hypothetical protein